MKQNHIALIWVSIVVTLGLVARASRALDEPKTGDAPAQPAATEKPKAPVAPAFDMSGLGFLAGRWVRLDAEGLSEEHWSAPAGNIIGMFRMMKPEGTVQVLELLTIAPEGPDVVMRLRHFDARLTPREEKDKPIVLRLESVEGEKAVFRKVSGSESLDRIVYDGSEEGKLKSEVGFTAESKRESLKFELMRERAAKRW